MGFEHLEEGLPLAGGTVGGEDRVPLLHLAETGLLLLDKRHLGVALGQPLVKQGLLGAGPLAKRLDPVPEVVSHTASDPGLAFAEGAEDEGDELVAHLLNGLELAQEELLVEGALDED